jgi:hypothetical protein
VRSIVKLTLVALVAYSVFTAAPSQQLAMYEGVKAFAHAIQDACTRAASPCSQGIQFAKSLVGSTQEPREAVSDVQVDKGPRRPLDGTLRPSALSKE